MTVHSRKTPKDHAARPVPIASADLFAPDTSPDIPALPVLGIDIAKATFRACLLLPGARSLEADFANNPDGFAALTKWLATHHAPRTRAGLEATGHYSLPLLRHLHDAGHHASLFNPRWIKDYARSEGRRNKTDAVDARIIARYITTHAARPWAPRSAAQDTLLALSRRREEVQRAQLAETQRLESAEPLIVAMIKRSLAHHQRQLQQIDKEISTLLRSDTELRRQSELLQSIPGIGQVSAVKILAELPGLESFERVRDAAAWAGLTPALRESGTSIRGRSRMNKQGNGRLRKAMYMPALTLLRSKHSSGLTRFRDRLLEAGKPKMVVIGALMRKLFQTLCGVLRHDQPFNNSLI